MSKLSRRTFLQGAAAVGGMAALAACGATPTPQIIKEVIKETVVVEKPVEKQVTTIKEVTKEVVKEVTKEVVKQVQVTPTGGEVVVPFITANWNWQKLNMANATENYNQQNRGKVRVQCDPAPDGWETKVREMVKANNVQWAGALCAQSVLGEISLVRMGIIGEPTPFIKASKVAWAKNFDTELIDAARKYFTFEGKLWAIPWDMEVFVRHYRTEEWGKLGAKPAETLDEWNKQLLELKKMFPKKIPLVLARAGDDPDVNNLMQIWTTEAWKFVDGQWCLDAKGDAFAQYLNLLKYWYDNKIITDSSWSAETYAEVWNKGDGMTTATSAAWCFATARKVFGRDAIDCVANPVLKKGDPPRGHTFSNGSWLFKGGPKQQEAVDWLLWMYDP
ncbi:MAG: twin-arginine translocation signal domain-containing protein, partial [Chloroflexota bacterium]|nr:twin-arginine translocation signal domain-containing protein [Chloroflexota bacterium]